MTRAQLMGCALAIRFTALAIALAVDSHLRHNIPLNTLEEK